MLCFLPHLFQRQSNELCQEGQPAPHASFQYDKNENEKGIMRVISLDSDIILKLNIRLARLIFKELIIS